MQKETLHGRTITQTEHYLSTKAEKWQDVSKSEQDQTDYQHAVTRILDSNEAQSSTRVHQLSDVLTILRRKARQEG